MKGMEYQVSGKSGELLVVTLEEGAVVLAEPGCSVFRRGGVGWSLTSPDRGTWFGRLMGPLTRRLAGAPGLMERFEGPGEVGLSGPAGGRIEALALSEGESWVVERRCLVGLTPAVETKVVLSEREGSPGGLVMMRLTGSGTAFVQAEGEGLVLELVAGEVLEGPVEAIVCFEGTVRYEILVTRSRPSALRRASRFSASLTGPGRVRVQASAWRLLGR